MDIELKKLPKETDFSLFDVDARRLPPGFYPHRHDYYELNWFTEAGGCNVIDFVSYPIRRDRIFFMAPGQVHELYSKKAKATFVAFGRGFVGAERDGALFGTRAGRPFVDAAGEEAKPLRALLELMRSEAARPRPSWAVLQSLVGAFLPLAMRCQGGTTSAAVDQRVAKLLDLVESRFLTERATEFYAKRVGLTPKRINEITRDALGKTVAQIISDRIILEAKRELHFTRLSVKEIAHALAYDDAAYFSRFFKRQTGLTPKAFRASRKDPSERRARAQSRWR